jgi:hypothetical protein
MKFPFTIVFVLIQVCFCKSIAQHPTKITPKPNAAQLAWQEAEMGAIFHYDLHVFDGKKYQQNGSSGNRTTPVPDYQVFSPDKLDTD